MMEEYSYFGCGRRERSFGDLTKDHFCSVISLCVWVKKLWGTGCVEDGGYKKKTTTTTKNKTRERERRREKERETEGELI